MRGDRGSARGDDGMAPAAGGVAGAVAHAVTALGRAPGRDARDGAQRRRRDAELGRSARADGACCDPNASGTLSSRSPARAHGTLLDPLIEIILGPTDRLLEKADMPLHAGLDGAARNHEPIHSAVSMSRVATTSAVSSCGSRASGPGVAWLHEADAQPWRGAYSADASWRGPALRTKSAPAAGTISTGIGRDGAAGTCDSAGTNAKSDDRGATGAHIGDQPRPASGAAWPWITRPSCGGRACVVCRSFRCTSARTLGVKIARGAAFRVAFEDARVGR